MNKTDNSLDLKKVAKEAKKQSKRRQSKKKPALPPVIMWAIVDNAAPEEPITFTATEEEAMMALDQYLYLKHYSHFRAWCDLRGLQIDHAQNWIAYSKATFNNPDEMPDKPLYAIYKINYEPNVIASLLRSVNHCVPMGLPFDTPEEIDTFAERINSVPHDELTPLEQDLLLLFDDIDDDRVAESAEIKKHCAYYSNNKKEEKKYDA